MRKNKILEKLLAIILIFTLTSANFAFVTKSFASSLAETLFGLKSDRSHENVEFEAYFGTEEEKETSVISDVNNEELAISMNLNIKESGYLKNAKIVISEAEEGQKLNFELKKYETKVQESNSLLDVLVPDTESEENNEEKEELVEIGLPKGVQSIEDNVVTLQQVNANQNLKINLPIEYKNEQYVNENKFSNNCLVKLTGVYIDDKGEENEISEEYNLKVSWKDDREVRVSTSVEKFVDYGKGVILQTLVRVDNSTVRKSLPVKESTVIIDAPYYQGTQPSKVTVSANHTMGTNGQTPETVMFGDNNWEYNEYENKLTIRAYNEKQTVIVNEYENEYLKDADREVIEEERFYNGSSYDEYLITYAYENVAATEEPITVSSNIEARMTTFSGVERDDYINIVTSNNNYEFPLQGKTGEIVSLYIESETGEVSKGYAYSNYNNSEKYEVELKSNIIANISYKELVKGLNIEDVENVYVDKNGNAINNSDLYYKQISISKDNFTQMLGENGTIRVLADGNEVATINNESEVNDGGFIVVTFEERYQRLSYEISEPVGEGNLIINNVKAMKNASVDKATLANIANMGTRTVIRSDYEFVGRVELGEKESKVNLLDTTSKVNLVMDRESLSTLETNTDVEMRLELNNAVDTSDVYGHSVYEITLPESIEHIEVTNASILYGEGLDITAAELDGRTIRITVDGQQEGINSGVLTNGTNIVINANLRANVFTPAKSDLITLNYSNNEATGYADNGNEEYEVSYSAPTGLVAVNSIYNYNNTGAYVTSVRQGEKEDILDLYSEAKNATMEIVVMNNNQNTVSNLAILGRIPFKGVKDIQTGEDLNTTLDTKLVSALVSDAQNNTEFDIYYSENPEATRELEDSKNGWTLSPESLDNIKSYLIVPVDTNYQMEEAQTLKFTYTYEIPANLSHNENIFGTFIAYYTNNDAVATTDEESVPDKVGLTTGAGPEVEIETSIDKESVKAGEEVKIDVTATNTGSVKVEDVVVELPINSEYVTFVSCENKNINAVYTYENNIVKVTVPELEREEKVEFSVTVSANTISVNNSASTNVEIIPTVTAKDLDAVVKAEAKTVKIIGAVVKVELSYGIFQEARTYTNGDDIDLLINIVNLSNSEIKNAVAEYRLPEEFSLNKAYVVGIDENALKSYEESKGDFDESSRIIKFNIDRIKALSNKQITINANVNKLEDSMTKKDIETFATVRADGIDSYESNKLMTSVVMSSLTVNQTTDNTDTYIKEGDTVTYTFTIKNEGDSVAKNVTLKDAIPDGLSAQKVSYTSNGVVVNKNAYSKKEAVVNNLSIEPKGEVVINVKTLASSLQGAQEKTVTNYATLTAKDLDEIQTNSITHIVEANEVYRNAGRSEQTTSNATANQATQSNIDKTYRISGTAWLDSNENGSKEDGETLLSGISAKLVNSETGIIQKSVTTDASGNYSFTGIGNGSYLIVFDYDTVKYTVTSYHKDGVGTNNNSDVVTTKIDQDGKSRNAAITDVITVSNGSISNVDIGLVLADTFDLKLEKTITNVMVQSANGTVKEDYKNVTMAKTEIASKYVSGATVYVEYEMKVSNVGDVSGYAKKIIDYIPQGMTFNSALEANKGWYTGTDGNLYYTGLADTELKSNSSKTIKLVLTKQMTEENTGIINNVAEIYEDYNIYGISDCNSTPGNKAQRENDMGAADVAVLIKTGEAFIYVSVIITSILLGSIVIFIAYNKIVLSKRKGGV